MVVLVGVLLVIDMRALVLGHADLFAWIAREERMDGFLVSRLVDLTYPAG